ncbi:MAG TPA: hypothetical protein VGL91_19505 [Acidobacteriota bacterium]
MSTQTKTHLLTIRLAVVVDVDVLPDREIWFFCHILLAHRPTHPPKPEGFTEYSRRQSPRLLGAPPPVGNLPKNDPP